MADMKTILPSILILLIFSSCSQLLNVTEFDASPYRGKYLKMDANLKVGRNTSACLGLLINTENELFPIPCSPSSMVKSNQWERTSYSVFIPCNATHLEIYRETYYFTDDEDNEDQVEAKIVNLQIDTEKLDKFVKCY